MKKILFVLTLITSLSANAQMSKDSLLSIMAKEACADIEKKDLSKIDKKNLDTEIGMMLMPTFMNHASEIEQVYGGNISDASAMQKMGMDLGMKLTQKCPKFLDFYMAMASKKGNPVDDKFEPANKTKTTETMVATLVSVTPGDITTLMVKDKMGKTVKLYWLEYFENADTLTTNNKKYLNKKVLVDYMEQSVYDAVKKTYKTIKVITGIDLQ